MNSILDALGYVGDVLNKPGRAVRGLLAGKPEEAAAVLPFSDSLGITDEANQTTGKDLLRHLGMDPGDGVMGDLAGFGTELATDPLSFLGAGIGAGIGRKAGAAAMARGPRFATTIDDIERMAIEGGRPGLEHVEYLRNSPAAGRVLSEIDPASSFLGAGAEGMAFKQPAGDVARIGKVPIGEPGRPVAEGILPATRTVDVPASSRAAYRVERSPLAEQLQPWATDLTEQSLKRNLSGQGIHFMDRSPANMGVFDNKATVIDPGAVDVSSAFRGGRADVTNAAEAGPLMSRLLDLIGSDEAVRAAIAAGRRSPGYTLPSAAYGGSAGLLGGAFGRSFGG